MKQLNNILLVFAARATIIYNLTASVYILKKLILHTMVIKSKLTRIFAPSMCFQKKFNDQLYLNFFTGGKNAILLIKN